MSDSCTLPSSQPPAQEEVIPAAPSDAEVRRLLTKYRFGGNSSNQRDHYAYGTAGFRYDHSELPPVVVRVGVAAALLSAEEGEAVGVMITASHNEESDNGVKLSAPDGGMMHREGEDVAVRAANERDPDALWRWILQQRRQQQQQQTSQSPPPTVHVGRDTREHSASLGCLVRRAVAAMGGTVVDHGVVTTPQLHHCVRHANCHRVPCLVPCRPNVAGYLDLLAHSYVALLKTRREDLTREPVDGILLVDCACGVGFPHLQALQDKIASLAGRHHRRRFLATNRPGAGPLNSRCGSEYVQKEQSPPVWYEEEEACSTSSKSYCAALDGDADRIVFFSCSRVRDNNNNGNDTFQLLDGDKIAVLLCEFLQEQMTVVRQALPQLPVVTLGVVQTAYANGASTRYLRTVLGKDGVCIAKTGVKHVHAAAHDNYDVGVYFEANGHGTILFGPAFYDFVARADATLPREPSATRTALQRLLVLPSLVNQAVGDALSDLLLVDAILQLRGWTLADWSRLYDDLPSRQCKVRVRDRNKIRTNDNETVCLSPAAVQDELNAAMAELSGRAFVRPSGTEDVVRVYAEAETRPRADELASRAAEIVHRLCDGVGDGHQPAFPTSRM